MYYIGELLDFIYEDIIVFDVEGGWVLCKYNVLCMRMYFWCLYLEFWLF